MAIWGGWHSSGGNAMRVGWDAAGDPVDTNTATYHVHIWFYVQTQHNYSGDVQALNFAGWIGGSESYTLTSGNDQVTLVAERDIYHNYISYGASPGNIQVLATVSGAYNGSTPSALVDIVIPARPYAVPTQPNGLNAWRDPGGTSATLVWNGTNTAQAPYDYVVIQHQDYGPAGWSGWTGQVSLPTSGGFGAFVWSGLPLNRIHAFQIVATNSVGISWPWLQFPWVYFEPAAPSNVAAVLGPTGTTIPVTWTNNAYSAIGLTTYTIERSVAGGAYAALVSGLSDVTTSWIDPTPGAGTNKYRVRAENSVAPTASPWAESNVVSTVVAPLAPTLLVPDGQPVDLQFIGGVLTWQHNPGGDYAAQTHFTIETSVNAGGTWQALATNIASAVSTYTVAAGGFTNGQTVLWKVKTQGGTTAGFGPFSNPATITAQTTPTVTLQAGHPADPTIQLPIDARWLYNQLEGVPQAGWQARLYAADGVTILEELAGDGPGSQATFTYAPTDGVTYVVAVRAQSGTGMWSIWVTKSTTVDLPPPAPTLLTATYQPCTGTMFLDLVSASPAVGEVSVDSVTVERRVAGGDWVVLARNMPPTVTMLDIIPLTNGLNEYRVTGYSTAPSTLVNAVVTVNGTDGQNLGPGRDGLWLFVAYGEGFSRVLRAHGDPSIQDSPGRVQKTQGFLGRRKPTLLSGIGTSREVSVGATLRYVDPCPTTDDCRYDSPPRDWVEAGLDAEVICYRDYTGRRLFASLDGVQVSEGIWPGNAALSFKTTEVDYVEVAGVLSTQRYQSVAPTDPAGSTDSFVMEMNNAKLLPVNSAGSIDTVVYVHGPGAGSGVGKRLYVDSAGSTDSATVVKN